MDESKFFTSGDMNTLIFFEVPKVLILGDKYKKMKPNALKLYIVLLDRMKLSLQNNWKNEKGQYYVRMSQDSSKFLFGWSPTTFRSMKKELEEFDLLLQEREGQGKTNRLYITKCEFSEEDIRKLNKVVDDDLEDAENKAEEIDKRTEKSKEVDSEIDDFLKDKSCSSVAGVEKNNSWPSRRTTVDLLEEQQLTTNKNYSSNPNINKNKENNIVNNFENTFVNKDITKSVSNDVIKSIYNPSDDEIIERLTNEYRGKGLADYLIHRVVVEVLDTRRTKEIENFGGYLRTSLEKTFRQVMLKTGQEKPKFESELFKNLF